MTSGWILRLLIFQDRQSQECFAKLRKSRWGCAWANCNGRGGQTRTDRCRGLNHTSQCCDQFRNSWGSGVTLQRLRYPHLKASLAPHGVELYKGVVSSNRFLSSALDASNGFTDPLGSETTLLFKSAFAVLTSVVLRFASYVLLSALPSEVVRLLLRAKLQGVYSANK